MNLLKKILTFSGTLMLSSAAYASSCDEVKNKVSNQSDYTMPAVFGGAKKVTLTLKKDKENGDQLEIVVDGNYEELTQVFSVIEEKEFCLLRDVTEDVDSTYFEPSFDWMLSVPSDTGGCFSRVPGLDISSKDDSFADTGLCFIPSTINPGAVLFGSTLFHSL